ncbi:GspH/FimT family pseudopilin [Aliikangiella sp. IMCC44359]|uniref:GspH/FimT family pseudopilin n=1 Tax=Aliikangiella sp. IMCC44359 TaxID=3459125 RepID=UPI00403AEDA6
MLITIKHHNIKQQGFTLIDLTFAIGIMLILFGFALPSFSQFLDRKQLISQSIQLRSTLQLARKTAITQHQKVTVCPTNDFKQCDKDWSKGYMVFVDLNENRLFDSNEKKIHQNQLNDSNFQLRWRAFGKKSSFQWHETGITNHQNGSFELCLKQTPSLARALIITKAGRIRTSTDKNNDGIHENSRGKNLSCKT